MHVSCMYCIHVSIQKRYLEKKQPKNLNLRSVALLIWEPVERKTPVLSSILVQASAGFGAQLILTLKDCQVGAFWSMDCLLALALPSVLLPKLPIYSPWNAADCLFMRRKPGWKKPSWGIYAEGGSASFCRLHTYFSLELLIHGL